MIYVNSPNSPTNKENSKNERNRLLKTAKNFDDILKISLDSLEGKYPLISCNSFITDDGDFDSLIEKGHDNLSDNGVLLYKMNEMGFLTLDSQSGLSNKETRQRAYVKGIIDKTTANRIYKIINLENDGIICSFVKHNASINISNIKGIPVTYVNNSNENKNENYIIGTKLHYDHKLDVIGDYVNSKVKKMLLEDYVTIYFIDTKFGRSANKKDGLFQHIITILGDINIL